MKRIIKKMAYRALARAHYAFYMEIVNMYIAFHNSIIADQVRYGFDKNREDMAMDAFKKSEEFRKEALRFAWVLGKTTCRKPTLFDKVILKLYAKEYLLPFIG